MKKILLSICTLTLLATLPAAVALGASADANADADFTYDSDMGWYTAEVTISDSKSQTIGLENVPAGEYVMSIQPNYTEYVEKAPTYWAQLDSAAKVELTENEYMYGELTGDFKIAEGDTQFTISTDYAETVEVYVMLYPVLEQNELPTTEETAATFTLWDNYEFQYTHKGATGFYTMASSVEGAEFGIEMKSNPVYYTGESIPDANYPVRLVQNEKYYFSMALVGLPADTPEEVDYVKAYFTFASWTPQAITLDRTVFVPVTPTNETYTTVRINAEDLVVGYNYSINLYQMYGTSITAHFVKADEKTEAIDPITSDTGLFTFDYSADIYGVYFTSAAEETFATPAMLSRTPSPSVDIPVGTATQVAIQAGETVSCTVIGMTATAANYNITINNNNVTVSGFTGEIIPQGQTTGMFTMLKDYYTEEYLGTALYFTNNNTADVNVAVIIRMNNGDFNLEANKDNEVTVEPQSKTTYFVPNLTKGTYLITLDKAENIAVYDYFYSYEPIAYGATGTGLYNLTLGDEVESATVAFTIENTGADEVTFTFNIVPVNSINVGYENEITVKGTQDYYIGGLENGRYQVELSNLPEGAVVSIMYGQTEIALNDEHIGYFTVVVPEGERSAIAVLTITVTGVDEATFGITVTETTDGDMELGVAQTVTLGANDTTETYALALASGKKYTVTLEGVPEGVSVYVAINGYYTVLYEGNTATFTMDFDSSTVQFTFFGEHAPFTFTATITEVTE